MDEHVRILKFRLGESSVEPKHMIHLKGVFSRFCCGESDSSAPARNGDVVRCVWQWRALGAERG